MKTIGINAGYIKMPYGGLGQFTYQFIKALSRIDTKNNYLLYMPEKSDLLNNLPSNFKNIIINSPNKYTFHKNFTKSEKYLKNQPDIIHILHFDPPVQTSKIKTIVTIHDILYTVLANPANLLKRKSPISMFSLSGFFPNINLKRKLNNINQIVAISQTTKNDLIKYLNTSPDKIKVIKNGINQEFMKLSHDSNTNLLSEYNLTKKKYFIYFGGNSHRKNVLSYYKAYIKLPDSLKQKYKLVIVGDGYFKNKIQKTAKNHNYLQNLVFTGTVSNEILANLVNNAYLSCYPSFYEGFGMPVLESYSCGVPCICSDIPSSREIAPKGTLFFKPNNYFELNRLMLELINDQKKYNKLINNGLTHLNKYSWDYTAQAYLNLYLKD